MTLTQRIKEIRLILRRPYFYVNFDAVNKLVTIIFESENDNEPRFIFTGGTLKMAVEEAERWINHEKTMGSLREREKPDDEPKKEEENKEEDF